MAVRAEAANAAVGRESELFAFDLFVVHAASDTEFVRGYLLPAINLPPQRVLLLEDLPSGASIVTEIDRAVTRSRFTVAVLTPAYLVDRWAVFGEQLATYLGAQDARVIPLQLIACELPLHLVASNALDFLDRAGWDDEAGRLRTLLRTPPPVPQPIACPYPGMRPFAASDASVFFGRDQELGELVARLDRGEREIYVIGPSGSGKSSLVHAGLFHALATGSSRLGRTFVARSMRPGDHPADRLARLLEAEPAPKAATPGTAVAPTEAALHAAVAALADHPPAERVLVFIDQLEELFTQASRSEQHRLFAALRALRSEPRCYLLLALRADFYGALMDSALWSDLTATGSTFSKVEVAPLRGPALAQAILQPALQVGVYLEARLCDRLVADAADEPGALPLVQETLRLLWDHLRHKLIGLAEYEALDDRHRGGAPRRGLDVAIAQHADTVMAELLPPRRTIARRVLLRLVSFGEGRADTRRQQPVSALRSAADDPDELGAVVQHLVAQRLLTVDDSQPHDAVADLAHDALITAWPALVTWVAERRVDEQRRRQLEVRVAGWIEHGRGSGGLLDRVELSEAENWLRSDAARELGYGSDISALVTASRAAVDEADRQHRRRTMGVIAGLAAFSLVASALGLVEYRQRNEARARAHQERVRLGMNYLDQGRTQLFDRHPLRAIPYFVAARDHEVDDPLLGMLFGNAVANTPLVTLAGHTSRVRAVAFSPDGSRAITASDDGTARIWNTVTGDQVVPPLVHRRAVLWAVFSPDGKRVATASADKTAQIWNATTGKPVTPPLTHESSVYTVEFSPDDTRVVTASVDKTAQIWNASTGAPMTPPLQHREIVNTAMFSADGTRVVTASIDRTARIWDAWTGAPVTEPLKHGNVVQSAAFSPNGKYVVTASIDGTAQMWSVATGEPVHMPLHHARAVRAALFDPKGVDVITASSDKTAQLWNVITGQAVGKPMLHPEAVGDVVSDPTGERVVTISGDGMARIWDLETQEVVTAIEHTRPVQAAAFSRDGTRLITASNDGTARIWSTSPRRLVPSAQFHGEFRRSPFSPDGLRMLIFGGYTAQIWNAFAGTPLAAPFVHDDAIHVAVFSADGTRVITGSKDSAARIWDARSGLPVTAVFHHNESDVWEYQGISAAAFSRDGTRVLTVGNDCIVRLWDARTAAPLAKPLVHEMAVTAAVFSPDGTRVITSSPERFVDLETPMPVMVRIWDATTGAPVMAPFDRQGDIEAFSPDGSRAITVGWETARVWDARTWTLVAGPLEHEGQIIATAFSADGTRVITASQDRSARIWDASTGKQIGSSLRHDNAVVSAAISPDGRYAVTGSSDHTARIWDLATGKPVLPWLEHPGSVREVAFSRDGKRVATVGPGGTRLWNLVRDTGSLDEWRALARCSPFVLHNGVLDSNPETVRLCPHD